MTWQALMVVSIFWAALGGFGSFLHRKNTKLWNGIPRRVSNGDNSGVFEVPTKPEGMHP